MASSVPALRSHSDPACLRHSQSGGLFSFRGAELILRPVSLKIGRAVTVRNPWVSGGDVCPVAFRSSPLQATYSLLGPRPENQLHVLTFSTILRRPQVYWILRRVRRAMIHLPAHPAWICHILSQCPRPEPAYLSIQQWRGPVRARGLALSTPGWTWFGQG
jgi:hypothetical protein